MEKLTYSAFAKRMGLNPSQVTRAVQTGKIIPETDQDGNLFLYFEKAKDQWEKNLDHTQSKSAMTRYKKQKNEVNVSSQPTITESKQKREYYLAEQEKIAYELLVGKIAKTDEIQKKWEGIITLARSKILAIPSKIRQRIPETTFAQYQIMEQIVIEALEDLGSGTT